MYYTLTYEKENDNGDDCDFDHIIIMTTSNINSITNKLRSFDDLAYQYYVSEYDGNPNDKRTKLIEETNGEIWLCQVTNVI